MMRLWVWYGRVSHRIHGYGTGMHTDLEEHWENMGHVSQPPPYVFVSCLTKCGLRVQVNIPPNGVLSDAGQPKGRPACAECESAT